MIAHLSGTLARKDGGSLVIDVGGVGYRVSVPLSVLSAAPAVGGAMSLHTSLLITPNTFEMTLYGFGAPEDQQLFLLSTSVSGVGPKVALSLLSVLDAGELARAIASSDTKALTRVPGVGPKLAQRLCLELGERVAELAFAQRTAEQAESSPQEGAAFEDVVEALGSLGYSRADSKRAAERAMSAAVDRTNVPALIRDALNLLSAKR